MPAWESTVLEVALADPPRETRVVSEPVHDPGQGGLLLAVERFGLSGSNITYAQVGNQFGLGYRRPFPAEDGWGRVPARVVAGDLALADIGDRFVGFAPMAEHMVMHAARTCTGLRDSSDPIRLAEPAGGPVSRSSGSRGVSPRMIRYSYRPAIDANRRLMVRADKPLSPSSIRTTLAPRRGSR